VGHSDAARHSLTARGRRGRVFLKRFLYSQLAFRSAVRIALGREQPLVTFTVEDDPPSVYLVFTVRPESVDALRADAGLPDGLPLAPIRCLADDEPRLLMALNVYRVSGITNGRRAEWSVFVAGPDGTPRYLVLDARSSSRSMDPVDLLTKASRVDHRRDGERIEMVIGPDGHAFRAGIDLHGALPADNAAEWVTANDRIYWTNGVYDRTFYDAGLADPAVVQVPTPDVTVDDRSRWSRYIDPVPVATLVFSQAIEFVVSPWANISDLGPSDTQYQPSSKEQDRS
jgi:hypothetical protein